MNKTEKLTKDDVKVFGVTCPFCGGGFIYEKCLERTGCTCRDDYVKCPKCLYTIKYARVADRIQPDNSELIKKVEEHAKEVTVNKDERGRYTTTEGPGLRAVVIEYPHYLAILKLLKAEGE